MIKTTLLSPGVQLCASKDSSLNLSVEMSLLEWGVFTKDVLKSNKNTEGGTQLPPSRRAGVSTSSRVLLCAAVYESVISWKFIQHERRRSDKICNLIAKNTY